MATSKQTAAAAAEAEAQRQADEQAAAATARMAADLAAQQAAAPRYLVISRLQMDGREFEPGRILVDLPQELVEQLLGHTIRPV